MKRFLKYWLLVGLLYVGPCSFMVMQGAEKLETLGGSSGPDTAELSEEEIGYQGNWVKKKEWVREAEEIELVISELIAGISAYRASFYDTKFAEVEKKLDAFYMTNKVEKGSLDGLIEGVEKTIEKKRLDLIEALKTKNSKAALDDLAVYEINEQVAALKALLEQVKVDIESIDEIDRGFEARFKVIDDIIAKTMGSSSEAQRYLQQIYYILDDKKVRQRVYKIKEILEQVKAVDAYLKNDLATDFDKLIATLNQHIEKTVTSIKQLEDKGIPLKQAIEKLAAEEIPRIEQKNKEAIGLSEKNSDEQPVKRVKKKLEEEPPFYILMYESIMGSIEWVIAQTKAAFDYLCGIKVEKIKVRKTRVADETVVAKK